MELFILIIINLILMAIFFIVFFVYFRQKFQEHWDDQKYLEGIRQDVNEMIKELNITTNRNVDLMEAKVQEVKEALDSAQRGTKTLGEEIKRHQKSEEVYLQLGKKTLGRQSKPAQGDLFQGEKDAFGQKKRTEGKQESSSSVDLTGGKKDSESAAEINKKDDQGSAVKTRENGRDAETQSPRLEPGALKARVTELHKKGISANLIAKNLGVTIGEVDFIIGLLGDSY
jgi:uncharacterized protein YoxC